MKEKERLIAEEEERFAEDCRKHNERIAEIQRENGSGWYTGPVNGDGARELANRTAVKNGYCKLSIYDYFTISDKADKINGKVRLWLEMQKWADENNEKFCGVYYILQPDDEESENTEYVRVTGTRMKPLFHPYYFSERLAEQAREKFGPEILRVWGK